KSVLAVPDAFAEPLPEPSARLLMPIDSELDGSTTNWIGAALAEPASAKTAATAAAVWMLRITFMLISPFWREMRAQLLACLHLLGAHDPGSAAPLSILHGAGQSLMRS